MRRNFRDIIFNLKHARTTRPENKGVSQLQDIYYIYCAKEVTHHLCSIPPDIMRKKNTNKMETDVVQHVALVKLCST